jgi:hypothetical protein
LLAVGWCLLALGLLLGIGGPRLTDGTIPADIADRAGDMDWLGLGWLMGGMIAGALAAMCFVAQWMLRPRNVREPADGQSR